MTRAGGDARPLRGRTAHDDVDRTSRRWLAEDDEHRSSSANAIDETAEHPWTQAVGQGGQHHIESIDSSGREFGPSRCRPIDRHHTLERHATFTQRIEPDRRYLQQTHPGTLGDRWSDQLSRCRGRQRPGGGHAVPTHDVLPRQHTRQDRGGRERAFTGERDRRNTGTKLFEDRGAGSHRATLSANRTYVPIAFGVVLCAGGLSLLGLPPLAAGTAAFEQMGRDQLSSG